MPVCSGEGDVTFSQSTDSVLVPSENTLTNTPWSNALPVMWAFISPVKMTHKINHQICDYFGEQAALEVPISRRDLGRLPHIFLQL